MRASTEEAGISEHPSGQAELGHQAWMHEQCSSLVVGQPRDLNLELLDGMWANGMEVGECGAILAGVRGHSISCMWSPCPVQETSSVDAESRTWR